MRDKFSARQRNLAFIILLYLTVFLTGMLYHIDSRYLKLDEKTKDRIYLQAKEKYEVNSKMTQTTMVSFEINAKGVLALWSLADKDGKKYFQYAIKSLLIDFRYILVYPLMLAMAILWAGANLKQRNQIWLSHIGTYIAWGQLAAACLDIVENCCLLYILTNPQSISRVSQKFLRKLSGP